MSKDYKKYLQKYATFGLAAMLISSPLSQAAMVYAEVEQAESTDEPVQATAPSETSQTETEKTNSMAEVSKLVSLIIILLSICDLFIHFK